MPYRAEAEVVLRTWYAVKRDLATVNGNLASVDAGTPEAERLRAEAVRLINEWAQLRAEYMWLIEAARSHHRPEPPPWPAR